MLKYVYLLLMLTALSIYTSAQNIKVANTSSPSTKKGYFDWTVLIQADSITLSSIDHVEYLLHPTFPNPNVNIYDKKSNFSYSARGWGEFEIKVKIVFKDPRKESFYASHWLKL